MLHNLLNHWENVYTTRQPDEVSWTQDIPKTSLDFIYGLDVSKDAQIIDVGGGDSKLVDFLLEEGYENITVLDISATALERAKYRLGAKASRVKWIVSDIMNFQPQDQYDIWHDRAAFHFLTTTEHIQKYVDTASKAVRGYMVIGTFSENGPKKCSGLDIKQYNECQLEKELSVAFKKIRCITEDHTTPFGTIQNFMFCSFERAD